MSWPAPKRRKATDDLAMARERIKELTLALDWVVTQLDRQGDRIKFLEQHSMLKQIPRDET